MVTVDCGAVSHEPFAEARKLGLDVVVFDHHQAPETLPDAVALVDPNREDDLSGLGYLCAAGVSFLALVALNRALARSRASGTAASAPDLLAALDLVALATVADVVPLTGLNRAFVVKGLQVMRQRRRPGLAALFDVAGADGPPQPYHLGFLIGPRINAGGRIGDAGLGARLLTTARRPRGARHRRRARPAEPRPARDRDRRARRSRGRGAAGARPRGAGRGGGGRGRSLAAGRRRPDRGAAQGALRPPAFALTFAGGHAVGSGRSIAGVDLGRTVRAAVESGASRQGRRPRDGGGRDARAGAGSASCAPFSRSGSPAPVAAARAAASLTVDAALTAGAATPELVRRLEAAGPYGSGNPEPLFVLPRHRLADVMAVGADHLRVRAVAMDGSALDAIAFRSVGKKLGEALKRLRGAPVHLAGTLVDQPLRRPRAGAAPGRRRGGGGAVAVASANGLQTLPIARLQLSVIGPLLRSFRGVARAASRKKTNRRRGFRLSAGVTITIER